MTALQQALSIYGAEEFSRLQHTYTMFGHTVTGPDYLAFVRPCLEENMEVMIEPKLANAWWVEIVIGRGALARIYSMLPYHLPRIGWMRGLKGDWRARFYDTDKLTTILTRN